MQELIRKSDVLEVPCTKKWCRGTATKQVCAPGHINGGFYDEHKLKTNKDIERLEKKMNQSLGGN